MSAAASAERRPCAVFAWCLTEGSHEEHVGEGRHLRTSRGREVRVWLCAEGDQAPYLNVELAYSPDAPGIQVVDLEAGEALELAGVLRELARALEDQR